MGQLIQPSCSCGYQAPVMKQGLGDSFIETGIYYEPAYCDHCGIVESHDGRETDPTCSRCLGSMVFYKEGMALEKSSTGLPDCNYLEKKKYWHCPACSEETLEFMFSGLWD
jgi:hypothetical protein